LSASFRKDSYSGKYEARVSIGDGADYPVTDLKWRALGRKLVGDGGEVRWGPEELRERLSAQKLYVSFGLSRLHQGRYWPLVVGVHPVPDYEVEIDYLDP